MDQSLIFRTDALILSIILFALMPVFIYGGRKFGLRKMKSNQVDEGGTSGTIVSSMFALLAFVLAFTFGMSGNRYDTRRKNIVDEANAIGTAILRADLYPEENRVALRKDFQQYLEARILYYDAGSNLPEVVKAKTSADRYGKLIWDRATQLSKIEVNRTPSLLMIPALNEMLDISTTRLIAELSRVPDTIVYMLFVLSLATSFYLGYSSAHKGSLDWFMATGFCLLTATVIYITLDLDRPRRGLIQLSTPHQAMVELRKMF